MNSEPSNERGLVVMRILSEKITLNNLQSLENTKFFPDMVKAVVDVDKGINIYYDGDIEFDSAINPPRNRDAGFPRVGRYVADPAARKLIIEVVNKWIEI